jgi:hypothetical protein
MASNSRYTPRDLERDLEHDTDESEDDSDYMDAEPAEDDIEMEDVEQGGSGNEGRRSNEDHEGGDGGNGDLPGVITLEELRELAASKFLAARSNVDLNTFQHNRPTFKFG